IRFSNIADESAYEGNWRQESVGRQGKINRFPAIQRFCNDGRHCIYDCSPACLVGDGRLAQWICISDRHGSADAAHWWNGGVAGSPGNGRLAVAQSRANKPGKIVAYGMMI